LYVKRLQPLQLALHICGNISSNISLVNQAEMPLPLGSGHPEFSAAHLAASGVRVVVAIVVGAGVVVGEGVVVGSVGANVVAGVGVVVGEGVVVGSVGATVVAGVGVVVGTIVVVIGAEQRA
jgi:hypothetical protein